MQQQLPIAVGGSIRYDPPELAAAVSATCTLTDPNGTEIDTPAVTVIGEVGTLDADAAAGSTSLTLVDATDVVVRRTYALLGASGDREWVRIRAVNVSTDVVTLYEPLSGSYGAGDTVVDNRLVVSVTGDQAAEIDQGYEARFVYTALGVVWRPIVRWDVVRSAWPEQLVSTVELRRYAPNILNREFEASSSAGLDFADLLEVAVERVRTDIRAAGRDPSRFRSFDGFRKPVCEAALLHLANIGDSIPSAYRAQPAEWADLRRREYSSALGEALGITSDYDDDQDGVVDSGEVERSGVRVTRWYR